MKLMVSILLAAVMAGAVRAQTHYAAKVTVNSGNTFVAKKLNIKGDRLYSDNGQSSSSLSMVSSIEFRFTGVSLSMCSKMFSTGDRKALEGLLEQYVGPVAQYSYLPTNLGDYLEWMLKAQYWNGNHSGAAATIDWIRKTEDRKHIDVASFYFTLMLMDEGKLEDAKKVFTGLGNPDKISEAGSEYIRGKMALQGGDPRQAMQHAAKIIAFHSRDPEWMAPATVLEARVYQRLGHHEKAAAVASELIIAYPDTQWSRVGTQIQKESKKNAGG